MLGNDKYNEMETVFVQVSTWVECMGINNLNWLLEFLEVLVCRYTARTYGFRFRIHIPRPHNYPLFRPKYPLLGTL